MGYTKGAPPRFKVVADEKGRLPQKANKDAG